ncbi:exosortase B [Curvibacter sp. CHRR-16]|uniref:exosortase B n=1 Tax=Curvibacter sp. CHRR-16 TaxID=2835872 RepID=UPI001BDB6910|nr:exosortase B [Curvibacter sp. CHRR-16]MBT0571517.1 exosortase B [Curvibacter sp. CHRR-16]
MTTDAKDITPSGGGGWLPSGSDPWTLGFLALALVLMYAQSYWNLAHTIWVTDEQGHGPIIFVVSVWLFFRARHAVAALPKAPQIGWGSAVLALSLLAYIIGKSQSFLMLEVGSQVGVVLAFILLFWGARVLRLVWFPLFFLVFMTPYPEALVAIVTAPLKMAVSIVASDLLYQIGYPVSRVGVILNVGPYQLLVADACAGLNSMFTLEALGLLYMNLMQYKSVKRNVLLAISVIPIAFAANVVRVMILVLVTYHMGNEAGQGFIHGFAGMLLFAVGLVLVLGTDYVLGLFFREKAV